jgi:hypothetical protein
MHELSSVLDDEVTIVTRKIMEDNNGLEITIIVV